MKRYKRKSQQIAGGVALVGVLALGAALWPKPANITHAESIPAWSLDSGTPLTAVATVDARPQELFSVNVTVTGYSSTVCQTDSTPFVTASNTRVRKGIVALSRDLIRRYTPGAPFDFGDRVLIEGVGEFIVEDTMNKRFQRRVDIWFPNRREARIWGHQKNHKLVKLLPVPSVGGGGTTYADAMAE